MSGRDSARREKLLDATVAVSLELGLRRASVELIAQTAGVSKGAVYLEFSTKAILLEAAIRREYRRYLANTLTKVESDPRGGRLSVIYLHSIAALLEQPFMRALYTDDGRVAAGLVRGPDEYRPRTLLGAEFVGQMVNAGLVRSDVDPAVVSHLLSVLAVGPLLAEPVLRDESAPPLDETFELLADLVVSRLEPAELGDSYQGTRAFRELVRDVSTLLGDGD